MSWLIISMAFFDDSFIFITVTLPFKYCPSGVSDENKFGKYAAIGSKCILLLLEAYILTELILTTFSIAYEHSISVPFSPRSPDTFLISTDNVSASTNKNKHPSKFSPVLTVHILGKTRYVTLVFNL